MCIEKIRLLLKSCKTRLEDKQTEKRKAEEIEEKKYIDSTKPNPRFQIKRSERKKVIKLIEYKFTFLAFLAIIVSLSGVNLNRLVTASSSYLLALIIYIGCASGFILWKVMLTFITNREVDDLVINKSYILITIEIISAVFLVSGLLVENVFIFDIVMSMLSIVPIVLGIFCLFTPTRIKRKAKKNKSENNVS